LKLSVSLETVVTDTLGTDSKILSRDQDMFPVMSTVTFSPIVHVLFHCTLHGLVC